MKRWLFLAWVGCTGTEPTGPAELIVGTGEYTFEAVADGQDVDIVAGPQGGYHVWVAFLAKNFRKSCVVETQLTLVETSEVLGNPFFFEVDLFPAEEEGWRQYAGLPHQLDKDVVEDQLVQLDVTVSDKDGAEQSGSILVVPRLQ